MGKHKAKVVVINNPNKVVIKNMLQFVELVMKSKPTIQEAIQVEVLLRQYRATGIHITVEDVRTTYIPKNKREKKVV